MPAASRVVFARGLTRQIGLWVALSTAAGLSVFACVAYAVLIITEEAEPNRDAHELIVDEARLEVGNAMVIAAPLGLLLSVAGAVAAARRAVRPLQRLIESAAAMDASSLATRLPLPAADGEVRALALTLNALLARLEVGFQTLDRFAAEASHELRTPLAVISAELEIMLTRPRAPDEWQATAILCLDEVRRLTQLTGLLLELSRAGHAAEATAGSAALGMVVERLLELARPHANARGVQLEAALDSETARSRFGGSGDALLSALLNVVENALRYTPSGGLVLIWSQAVPGDATVLHVDDTGPGIDPNEYQHVFEPFARGKVGRKQAGFGLGLAIARRISEHSGVTLSVGQSAAGGARFSFCFRSAR